MVLQIVFIFEGENTAMESVLPFCDSGAVAPASFTSQEKHHV